MSESVAHLAPCREVRFTVLCETKGSNAREHFHTHAHRVEKERDAVALAFLRLFPAGVAGLLERTDIVRVPRGITRKTKALAKKLGKNLAVVQHVLRPAIPLVVELTRVSFGRLDDDNLRAALKGVRDQIAWEMGISDRDPLVRWDYDSPGQRHGPKGSAAVCVRIRARELVPNQPAEQPREAIT